MKLFAIAMVIVVSPVVTIGSRVTVDPHAHHAGMHNAALASVSPVGSYLALPTAENTRVILEGAIHNSEFTQMTAGRDHIDAYVSYPDRGDKAPVLLITTSYGMSNWTRAVAYQASRSGFIAIAANTTNPDGRQGENAARRFATGLPAANGTMASVRIADDRITARVGTKARTSFALTNLGWSQALAFLKEETGDRFEPNPHADHVAMAMRAEQAGRGGQAGRGAPTGGPRRAPGLNTKVDDLPAPWAMADKIAATTPRRHEWIDVPMADSAVKVHTWVVYPDGEQRVGAVLVLAGAQGVTDWTMSLGDQVAKDGFIALVVDLSSGLGPNGGNWDSFKFLDDKMKAMQSLGPQNTMARIKAVRDYAAKMPRSNGKTGSIGFCGGGTNSFTLATDVPEHNASVVYYGAAPPPASLAKTTAPVIGFYGEEDSRIFSTVEPTRTEMARLGKTYEAHTYPHTTHSFLWMQDLGDNFEATSDSWPRAVAFLRKYLS